MIDAPALIGFVAIADAGSVHAAARQLNMSQAALSRRLQRLEDALHVRLFVRTGRRLKLSAAGARLLPEARTHVDGLIQACASIRDESYYGRPTVTVAAVPSVCTTCAPVLRRFLEPRSSTRLRLLDVSATEVVTYVGNGTADFGVTPLGMDAPGLAQEAIGEDPVILAVTRHHPLADRSTLPWRALGSEPLIISGGLSGHRRLMENVRSRIKMDLGWKHEVQHLSTAVSLVAAGVAHAILPMLALPKEALGEVAVVRLEDPSISRRIGIVRRVGEPIPAGADALRRAIIRELRAALKATAPD
jgi:DNA-binding transcriptional LysR family regulator